jgi:hypothetical protein
MGRASSRKKLDRTLLNQNIPIPNSSHAGIRSTYTHAPVPMAPAFPTSSVHLKVSQQGTAPEKFVYRFFNESKHAEDFVRGKIWISTLETCRKYEDPRQGDPGEGSIIYHSGSYENHPADDAVLIEVARRSGVGIRNLSGDITFSNNVSRHVIPDALVLCATTHYDPEVFPDVFGKYCVEIRDPNAFFMGLTQALAARYAISSFHSGSVTYSNREYSGLQSAPGRLGFVKPVDLYCNQQEFRMLWIVNTTLPLTPGMIQVPKIARYCRLAN